MYIGFFWSDRSVHFRFKFSSCRLVISRSVLSLPSYYFSLAGQNLYPTSIQQVDRDLRLDVKLRAWSFVPTQAENQSVLL